MSRLVMLSDTHTYHSQVTVPAGDILIHAGDMCGYSSLEELIKVVSWLKDLPHKHKVVIGGNHDRAIQNMTYVASQLFKDAGIVLLWDSGCEIDGIKFWGSPTTPIFGDWAFMKSRGEELARHWANIPADTDVLITHGPPYGILDKVGSEHAGDVDLLQAIERVKPKVHVFGHIHGGYGSVTLNETMFINAAICTEEYRPINPVQIYDYETR